MVCAKILRSQKSSFSSPILASFIERLIQEIDNWNLEKEKLVKSVKKYTVSDKKKIAKFEEDIRDNRLKIELVNKMLSFPPGSWVYKSDKKPGRVIELKIAGRIPEVHVLWEGHTVPVPERPQLLSLIDKFSLSYVWDGDRHPKLIRKFDRAECLNIEAITAECEAIDLEDPLYREKKIYCKKRIIWLDSQDLARLEHTVEQGLEAFYKVGEALAEIRDRKLYKQQGYKDFRVYLKERWNMGKSKAYRLIESAEVVDDIKKSVPNWGQNQIEESVHHGGQNINLIPQSEAVAREVKKAPPELRGKVMQLAVKANPVPTATDVKAIVQKISLHSPSIEEFKVGQIVRINSDRTDKRLVGHNKAIAVCTKVNPSSVDLELQGISFEAVSPNDLEVLSQTEPLTICSTVYPQDYAKLILKFDSPEKMIEAALAYTQRSNE